jgi:hypothetical protein
MPKVNPPIDILEINFTQDDDFAHIRHVCAKCGRVLFGDYEYNFTHPAAHRACRNDDGSLTIKIKIDCIPNT